MGGWRVAIVDSADELNAFGANALLKTLEEPPARAILILLAHGEAPLLPTLKSRCRRLRFDALKDDQSISVLIDQGLDEKEAREINALCPGRPGRALTYRDDNVRAAARAMMQAASVSSLDPRKLNAAMSAAAKSDAAFSSAFDALLRLVHKNATSADNALLAGGWSSLHSELSSLYAESRAINMDKSQAIATALLQFQKTQQSRLDVSP